MLGRYGSRTLNKAPGGPEPSSIGEHRPVQAAASQQVSPTGDHDRVSPLTPLPPVSCVSLCSCPAHSSIGLTFRSELMCVTLSDVLRILFQRILLVVPEAAAGSRTLFPPFLEVEPGLAESAERRRGWTDTCDGLWNISLKNTAFLQFDMHR